MSITTTPVEQNSTPSDSLSNLPAVFGERPWRKSAPAKLRNGEITFAETPAWDAWQDLLKPRAASLSHWKRESTSPFRWGMEDVQPVDFGMLDDIHAYTSVRTEASGKKKAARGKKPQREFAAEQAVKAWLAESAGVAAASQLAAETLALCYAAPRLTKDLPADLWWDLLARLVETVQEAQQQDPQAGAAAYQMLAGEAALALAVVAPELRVCREFAKAGCAATIAAFDQLLDGAGTPHRDYLVDIRSLAASWLRCQVLLKDNASLATKQLRKAFKQFDDVLLAIANLTRLDGSQHFGPVRKPSKNGKKKSASPAAAVTNQWMQHLAAAADDQDAGEALRVALGISTRPAQVEQADDNHNVGGNAEWSELAALRTSWQRSSPRILVDYGQPEIGLELSAKKGPLCGGTMVTEISVDGNPLSMSPSWTCVCWQSDSDCDYLELEAHPAPGMILQRSIMLAHEDCFAWVADSVACGREHELEYRLSVPLAAGVGGKFDSEHTEAELTMKKKPVARVMPLALPEWRSAAHAGNLSAAEGQLALQHRQRGWGLYAGVFIDLDPTRLRRSYTWRSLTVASEREILPADLAVAQRVQIGAKHWVFYRSVGARGNRTFLGINVSSELLAARFETDGEYETLVEVL
ncbi:MAG: hypothetical protein MPJ50_09045 [Pirellulales bacterium]|nr:hypothetical protein [Pirellulales bacterium]